MRLKNRWLYAGFLLLLPALAVTAFAQLPTIAHAETSSGIVYDPTPRGIESNGEEATPKPAAAGKVRHGHQPKTGEESPAETTPGAEGEPGSKDHRPHPATGEDGGHPPGGGGGPKEGGSPKPSAHPGSTRGKQPERTPTRAVTGGGGGSSPVMPILIVMAVLAALSIGTVIYRGRRQNPTPGGLGRDSA